MKFTPNLTRSEQKSGLIAMAICLLVLPTVLGFVLPNESAARLTFITHFINAGVIIYILRRFLLRNLEIALAHPIYTIYYAALGYMAHTVLTEIVMFISYSICPDLLNLNDQNVTAQLGQEFGLMAVTVVVLAPIGEECFFRGLLLRGLYDRSPALAWVLSAGLFAAVHVIGYIGLYSPVELVLAFFQYLPSGVALCIAYQRGGSILSPILTHMIVNAMALWQFLA